MNTEKLIQHERERAVQVVMDLFFALREIKDAPTLKDLVKLAKRLKYPPKSHCWGEWPNEFFAEVDNAAFEIGDFCRKWGRIQVRQTKEKYGTARVYCSMGCDDLHSLLRPGYGYVCGPYRLMTFPIFRPLRPLVLRWQRFIYRLAYKRAIEKYPHIREEILCAADWPEFLEGF